MRIVELLNKSTISVMRPFQVLLCRGERGRNPRTWA